MDIHTFIGNYREAFGQQAGLPIVFWYSDQPEAPAEKVNGCFFKSMAQVRNGKIISLNAETIGCGGGKFYTGFTDMPEHVPGFVSLKEKYKKTPDMVVDFIQELQVPKAEKSLPALCTDRQDWFFRQSGRHIVSCYAGHAGRTYHMGFFSTAMQRMPYQLLSVRAVVP